MRSLRNFKECLFYRTPPVAASETKLNYLKSTKVLKIKTTLRNLCNLIVQISSDRFRVSIC